ncbi:hypothetical protein FB382_000642 [Nocardioides ginsengisegetis]|uniref:Uncharacterized protein n=1 Tax=Nocardioides ginsengisegetis TaxID=661491 RepID=A0A7W3IXC9_9ACTN|nr:DUF5719 family protein [Nocardioides ginsengisegetis]MBA8802351.1 hypothetical protein [Nocardioides ginsengisegetis]
MSTPAPTNPGARSSRRVKVDVTTALAVGLPILTVLAVLLVQPGDVTLSRQAPTRTPLTSASVVCPSPVTGSPDALVSTDEKGASGELEVEVGKDSSRIQVAQGRATPAGSGDGPVVVNGHGDLAPGLFGSRLGGKQLAGVPCSITTADQWFTGVGAGAGHTSQLELVNPDAGPAVADITLYGRAGTIDVPRLRGVSVPGHSSLRLDLGKIVPRRDELTMHVVTSRGRLASSVLDTYAVIGGAPSSDWLAPQAAPATSALLLGTPGGAGKRTLVLTNPGEDETRVSLKIVSERSVFAPEGMKEIRLAPGSVKRVSLTEQVASAITKGGFGLQVESTSPVTATLRSFVGGDLSHATPGSAVTEDTAAVVPIGGKRLLLAGASGVGVVTVVATSASGEELSSTRAEVRPGAGTIVTLPPKATIVSIAPSQASVVAAVEASGNGTAVLPLTDLLRNGLIPGVRPGLP